VGLHPLIVYPVLETGLSIGGRERFGVLERNRPAIDGKRCFIRLAAQQLDPAAVSTQGLRRNVIAFVSQADRPAGGRTTTASAMFTALSALTGFELHHTTPAPTQGEPLFKAQPELRDPAPEPRN